MPDLPQIWAKIPSITDVHLPRASGADYGADLFGELADTIPKLNDGADKANATKLALDYNANAKGSLKLNNQQISDPNEFHAKTTEELKQHYDNAIAQARSPKAQQYLENAISADAKNFQTELKFDHFGKVAGQANADTIAAEDQLVRAAVNSSGEEQNQYMAKFGKMMGSHMAAGFQSKEKMTERLVAFNNKVINARTERFAVGLQEELNSLTNDATTGNQAPEQAYAQGLAKIDGLTDIPLAKRDAAKAKFKDALWTGTVEGQIEKDPFQADKELHAGRYNGLVDQQSLRFLKNKAVAEIDRIARNAEAQRKQAEHEIGKQVDDFKTATMNGFPWSGNVAQLAQAVKGTEHAQEFMNTVRDSQELMTFGQMGPLQQENYLRSTAQTPKSGDEAQVYKKLEAMHEQTKRELKDDALTYAIRRRAIPNVSPFDLSNPNSLKERSIVAGMVETRYGVPASPLSDDEAQALSDKLGKAPADQAVQMLRQLRRGLDDRYVKAVAAQLAKKKDDPVLAQAMALSLDDPQAASRILRGRDIMRDNKEIMPKGADLKTAQDQIASTIGEAYQHNPEHYAAVSDAAMAIYAFKNWQARELTGDYTESRMKEAIKEASGGVLTLGSLGGRYTVQAPRAGVDEAGFMDALKRADYSKAKDMSAADIQKQGKFESIGDGRYLVKIGPGYVMADKEKFVLDLNLPARAKSGAVAGGAAGLVR